MPTAVPSTPAAYKLFHQGALALSQVEEAGMCVDVGRLNEQTKKIGDEIKETEEKMRADENWPAWRKRFGDLTNPGSSDQLAWLVHQKLGFPCESRTKTGKPKSDAETLSKIPLEICRHYGRRALLEKLHGTYLRGLQNVVVDGFIHTNFNLNTVETFRSSSSDPNLQNLPIRNPWQGKIIRSCFRSRFKGGRIVDRDYGQLEVRVACWYHHDPVMESYLLEDKDMHRDMAAQCFMVPDGKEPHKAARGATKGGFVFAQFYGDYFRQCAYNLWVAAKTENIPAWQGTDLPMLDWLRDNGIAELGGMGHKDKPVEGTFIHHIAKVEDDFWNNRFRVYGQWRRDFWEEYQREGGWWMHTGFRVEGVYRRNQVINSPVQGAAFHTMIQALIWLVKELKKRKMRTVVICQIHDSIVADVPPEEFDDYLALSEEIMVRWIPKAWDFVTVPLTVEAEATPPGGDWSQKEKVA